MGMLVRLIIRFKANSDTLYGRWREFTETELLGELGLSYSDCFFLINGKGDQGYLEEPRPHLVAAAPKSTDWAKEHADIWISNYSDFLKGLRDI
jgi:alkanesulfonate monooxygenase SsuD/methylene tetrahydromethanopterin reductase-like flavin-dependent oxidoreductase (luciferase family)